MNFRELAGWAASPVGTDKWVAALFFTNTVLTSFAFGNYSNLPPRVPIHLADLLTAIVGALLILAGNWIRGAFKPLISEKGNTGFNLAVWVFVAASPIGVQFAMLAAVQQNPNFDAVIAGIAPALFQNTLLLLGFTVFIGSWRQSREAAIRLATEHARLEQNQTSFSQMKTEIENRIHSAVEGKLSTVLQSLRDSMTTHKTVNREKLAHMVLGALNEGVRPLSWELSSDLAPLEPAKSEMPQKISLAGCARQRIELRDGLNLAFFTLFCLIFEPSTAFSVLGVAAGLQILGVIAIINFVYICMAAIFGKHKIPAWALVLGVAGLAFTVSQIFVVLQMATNPAAGKGLASAFPFSIAALALATSLHSVTLFQREQDNRELADVNQRLVHVVSRLEQAAWQSRQRFARLVHGPVQSALLVAYLKLKNSAALDPLEVAEITATIADAGKLLDQPEVGSRLSIPQMVDLISAGWDEHHSFHVSISAELQAANVLDEVASESVYETLRESVNNAVKHGLPGVYQIMVSLAQKDLLQISVINPVSGKNGYPGSDVPEEMPRGFGTSILDTVTLRHSLEIADGIAIFTALIAIGPPT